MKIILRRETQLEEMKSRTKIVCAAFVKLRYVLTNKKILLRLRTKVFVICILLVLTYGAQT